MNAQLREQLGATHRRFTALVEQLQTAQAELLGLLEMAHLESEFVIDPLEVGVNAILESSSALDSLMEQHPAPLYRWGKGFCNCGRSQRQLYVRQIDGDPTNHSDPMCEPCWRAEDADAFPSAETIIAPVGAIPPWTAPNDD